MNYPELFAELKKEFPEDIALGVVVATGIHLSTKVSKKDYFTEGRYTEKVVKKIRDNLWEYSDEDLQLILDIHSVVYDWGICRGLEGLGGCTRKTFKELIEKGTSVDEENKS